MQITLTDELITKLKGKFLDMYGEELNAEDLQEVIEDYIERGLREDFGKK